MSPEQIIFLIMVFLAVALLATSIFVPTVGAEAKAGRRMRARIHGLVDQLDSNTASLLNEKYLRDLSSLGRWMQQFPGMIGLAEKIEQAGWKIPAYRLVLVALSMALITIFIVSLITHQILLGLLVGAVIFYLPFLKLKQDSQKRMMQFEEQLPDALDSMSRALRAGHPFIESIRLIAEEMDDPISGEFQTTFSDITYGVSTKVAFYALPQRYKQEQRHHRQNPGRHASFRRIRFYFSLQLEPASNNDRYFLENFGEISASFLLHEY